MSQCPIHPNYTIRKDGSCIHLGLCSYSNDPRCQIARQMIQTGQNKDFSFTSRKELYTPRLSAESRGLEVKGNKKTESKEETKEVHFCKQCKFYDHSSERQFHRDGIRLNLIETRGICKSTTARARGHLVMAEYSKRNCPQWEAGVYEPPTKVEKPEETKKVDKPEEKGQPQLKKTKKETVKSTKKSRKQTSTIITNRLNGQVKRIVQNGRKTILVEA